MGGKHVAATAVEAHIVDCRPFAGVPGDGAPRPWAAAKRAVLRRVGASGHHPPPPLADPSST